MDLKENSPSPKYINLTEHYAAAKNYSGNVVSCENACDIAWSRKNKVQHFIYTYSYVKNNAPIWTHKRKKNKHLIS